MNNSLNLSNVRNKICLEKFISNLSVTFNDAKQIGPWPNKWNEISN